MRWRSLPGNPAIADYYRDFNLEKGGESNGQNQRKDVRHQFTRVRESSDDFKKLLQGQNDNGSKDVSKDAKTEKTEPVKEQKKEEPAKADNAQEEAGKEEQVQNNGLLAAYQMAQNFRPEMIQPERSGTAGRARKGGGRGEIPDSTACTGGTAGDKNDARTTEG